MIASFTKDIFSEEKGCDLNSITQLESLDLVNSSEMAILSFMNDNYNENFSIYETDSNKSSDSVSEWQEDNFPDFPCNEKFFVPSELMALTTDKYPELYESSENKDCFCYYYLKIQFKKLKKKTFFNYWFNFLVKDDPELVRMRDEAIKFRKNGYKMLLEFEVFAEILDGFDLNVSLEEMTINIDKVAKVKNKQKKGFIYPKSNIFLFLIKLSIFS